MRRQILSLYGIAILAVVLGHTTAWQSMALTWWGARYGQLQPPPYHGWMSGPTYYVLVVIRQLTVFSVPAFLFLSGLSISYAARGSQKTLSWKVIKARLLGLLWPYLLWVLLIFVVKLLESVLRGRNDSLLWLISIPVRWNFFIPLLAQFLLLSPLIVRLGASRPRLLLLISALMQLTMMALQYLYLFRGPYLAGVKSVLGSFLGPSELFFWHWALYFPLGVVCGLYSGQIARWLARVKRLLLIVVLVFGLLTMLETEWLYSITQIRSGLHHWKLSSLIYILSFIFFYLSINRRSVPFVKRLEKIGSKTLGIYLIHQEVLELTARVTYHVAPWMFPVPALFLPVLLVAGVAGPMLLMALTVKTPARKLYHYVFG